MNELNDVRFRMFPFMGKISACFPDLCVFDPRQHFIHNGQKMDDTNDLKMGRVAKGSLFANKTLIRKNKHLKKETIKCRMEKRIRNKKK